MWFNYKKTGFLATAIICSMQIKSACAEGFGLRAGPFEFILETEEHVDDFVVALDNLSVTGEGNIWKGGAYNKITHGASNAIISFPRGALYDWTLAGNSGLSGKIEHPLYLKAEIAIVPTGRDEAGVKVIISKYGPYERQEHIVSPDQPIRINIKMVKTEDYIRHIDHLSVALKSDIHSNSETDLLSEDKKKREKIAQIWQSNTRTQIYFMYFLALGHVKEKIEKYGPYLKDGDYRYYIENKEASDEANSHERNYGIVWRDQFLAPNAKATLKTPTLIEYPHEIVKQK